MMNFRSNPSVENVRVLNDGKQAIEYLTRQNGFSAPQSSPRPRLVLLDLRLPKIDGIEVLKKIKQDSEIADIPVVIFTTSDANNDIRTAYDNHANSYLVKPVGFRKFNDILNQVAEYWLNINEGITRPFEKV